jgi:hypothetical protein
MPRRVVTLVLLPAILLTQWAGMFRCVGGCGAVGLENTPHVHLNALLPAQAERSGCGCQRSRQVTSVPNGSRADETAHSGIESASSNPKTDFGRDDPVVYVSAEVGVVVRAHVDAPEYQAGGDEAVGLPSATAWSEQPAGRDGLRNYMPPRLPHLLPVYILTRSLLL